MVARNASAVNGPTPGTVISRRQVGSTRTSSSARLVSRSTSRVITSITDSNDSVRLTSTGSAAARPRTRAGKSLRLGVPPFSPPSRSRARTPFSTSRRLLSTIRRAVSSARQERQDGLFTCTARYQPVRMICAIPRASLRSVLFGMRPSRPWLGVPQCRSPECRPPSVPHAARPSASKPQGRPAPFSSPTPRRRQPVPPVRSPHAPHARSFPHYRQCRSLSLPTTRPTRQSNPRLLLLEVCGRCTRTTFYHPERGSHRITGGRPQSPHPSENSHLELLSFLSISLIEASLMNARALRVRFSKSLANRRHLLSQARVRSTTQRRGRTSKPWAVSERLTISTVS